MSTYVGINFVGLYVFMKKNYYYRKSLSFLKNAE